MPGNTNKLLFRLQRDILAVLFVLLFLPVANAQVQVYPVSVTTQLITPYSVNLADYAAPGSGQLKVIIVQRDLTQAPYRLFLKMNIELNGRTIIRSAPLYVPPPLTLDPGIPTVFSGSDLSPFFDPDNMDFVGYSRDAYMRSKLLPEGAYVITFTAYDWTRRGVALSNGGSFFCYLAKADPPLLNLPVNNAVIPLSTPQYINFHWLSRTTSSPNSAYSTIYRFELFEMRVGGISPGEIVQSSRPIFTAETDRTSLIYSIAEPSLEKGMRYVWRVKASDVQGRDYIRNNGLSEVFSFIYGGEGSGIIDFSSIENFMARAVTPKKAGLTWDPSDYDSYKIFYRKKGDENKWYESETIQNEAELKGLSPGTVYECKVQGKKGSVWGNVSDVDTVSMPLPAVIECGSPFTPLAVSNNEPLAELLRLQQFDAGGFVVTLTDPYAISIKPGVFSGKGFVEVPLFGHKKIRCEFRDIFINTDYQMVRGQVQLITDNSKDGDNAIWSIDDVFEGGTDNGIVRSGTEEASVVIPETVIDSPEDIVLDIAGKEILVVNESSDTVHIDVSEKLAENPGTLTVQDSEGNLYSVDTKTGKSTSLGKAPAAGSSQQIATIPSVLDNRKGIVSFGVIPEKTRFAYDKRDTKYARSNLFNEEYRTVKMNDGSLYDVPFKLIPSGETDVISAKVEIKGKKISPDSVVFRSGTGTIYKPVRVSMDNDGRSAEYHLTLPSGKDNDGIEVYATYTDSKRQTFVLGKMIVMSYSVKKPKLTLVPVNGNGINTDINIIKKELDRIYLPVAVDWQVSLDEDFNVTIDSLRIAGSGLFSTYTDEMKQLNSAFIFHKEERFDPSTIYLFMLQFSENQSATGDMPRGNQFGYIFSRTAGADEAIYRTIAHEIAHGTFSLKHTFDSQYQIPQGTTSNLLDYTAGTDLVKHQWDAIHDPGLVIGMFERDEDGMMMADCWFYWTFISGWKVSEYAGCKPMDEKIMNSIGYFSIRQKIELDRKRALEAKAIEEAKRRVQAQIAAYEFNKSQNLFYIIYQLSPFSTGTQAAINISNGEYGWATFNAAITLLGGSELRSLMTSGRSLTKVALGEVWKEGSFNRNVFLKNTLFKSLYKTANDIAAARYSLFPVIDFLENGTGIVFRTVDDFSTGEIGLLKTIDELSNAKAAGCIAGATGEVKVTTVRLDIGVPGGSSTVLPDKIGTHAKSKGVGVSVFEIVEDGEEIVAKTTSNLPAIVRQLTVKPKYLSSRIIFSNPDKTITVIGRWQGELEEVYKALSAQDLNIYMLSGKFEHKGGFNMLSMDDWSKIKANIEAKGIKEGTKAFDDYIWDNYNKPWLESALQRGDDVVIWSNPNELTSLEKPFTLDMTKGATFFARELDFIKANATKYGYDYNKGVTSGTFSK